MNVEKISHFKKNKSFLGKNVLITGATGGIGSILMESLAHLGAKIVVLVKDTKKLKEILIDKNLNPEAIQAEKMDFELNKNYREVFTNIMLKLGGKLDMLFICHGYFENGELIGTKLKEYDRLININTRSTIAMMSLAAPFLKYTEGNIVAISSLESFIPVRGSFLNTITKSMVNSIIKNAALELASFGVRVNGVAPGVTNTTMRINIVGEIYKNNEFMKQQGLNNLLDKKVIEPSDVVDAMLFLASNEAKFITGEIIIVDNGYSLNHDLCFSEDAVI